MSNERLIAAARDELFSHVNRCGVLQATVEDQTVWMDETIDYLGERYPDLTDVDLKGLHAVGLRFCQPAINNIPAAPEPEVVVEEIVSMDEVVAEATGVVEVDAEVVGAGAAPVPAVEGDAAVA